MRILFIGHFEPGSTSRMRGLAIKYILNPDQFTAINLNEPILETARIFRSIGWRYYAGPLIWNINKFIRSKISDSDKYDLVWVDKGVFVDPAILADLKSRGASLVHSTPDTAFFANRSQFFLRALPLYDYCLTTKSFEVDAYSNAGVKELLFYPQGYDKNTHYPRTDFWLKEGIAFVGLYEPWRAQVIERLLEENILVKLAGVGWEKFSKKMSNNKNLHYLGKALFGSEYSELISSSVAGLGLLSRKFPELHTTRTIEIPACGTTLITEDNMEIRSIFRDDEVIYFTNLDQLIERVSEILSDRDSLMAISEKGFQRVINGKFEYREILEDALIKMKLK